MKTKLLVVLLGITFLGALVYRLALSERQVSDESVAGYAPYRLDGLTYNRLAKQAQAGDCDAAYRLARHHAFYSLNRDEAVRWYRTAAKCPNVDAKEELIGILMYTPDDDREVDRLVSEIEQINAKKAEHARTAVASMRTLRDRPEQ